MRGRKKLFVSTTFSYWFLLTYLLAALIWWFISLQKQSHEIASLEIQLLEARATSIPAVHYQETIAHIRDQQKRANAKFIGEGITFLILTMIGAFFVYRSVRKQMQLQAQERNFMMAITHELKTPIAISKLNLETLQKHKLDENRQQKLLASTLQETERLNTLTNNILVSAQLESKNQKTGREELDLSNLFRSTALLFMHRFPERAWELEIEADIAIDGDPLLLQILLNNLLENAVKYSPRTSPIQIAFNKEEENAVLQVKDQGAGIPAEEKSRIFQKFYRIGNEETRRTTGTGLGLYLCKIIADQHNADVKVTDNQPAGSTFTVKFHTLKST